MWWLWQWLDSVLILNYKFCDTTAIRATIKTAQEHKRKKHPIGNHKLNHVQRRKNYKSHQTTKRYNSTIGVKVKKKIINTLRTGDADLRFYITTVQDGSIHLIMQYREPVSEWSCWRMFIETWPHSELTFRHRVSSI